MKVLICGAGQVGANIARYLASEDADITVIDQSPELVQKIVDSLDVTGLVGFASHPDILEQAGARDAELVIAVMTQAGLDSLLNSQVTFGVDANLAVVGAGLGVEARTGLALDADMYAFARNRGLFAGGTFEGSGVRLNEPATRAYYGAGATSQDVINGGFTNPGADSLRVALAGG